ncbi:hypothetical protein F5Y08DRAFT_345601 [Xylaria arbuscula]|nr:hypothetical protein F5Y08DRAFT_345601 [Xylaria arbuscula]
MTQLKSVENSEKRLSAELETEHEDLEALGPPGRILVNREMKVEYNIVESLPTRMVLDFYRSLVINGLTLLHYAVLLSIDNGDNILDLEPTKLLLSYGADPNAITHQGVTPILLAVDQRQPKTIEALLWAGADPTIEHKGADTAEQYARRNNLTEATEAINIWREGVGIGS